VSKFDHRAQMVFDIYLRQWNEVILFVCLSVYTLCVCLHNDSSLSLRVIRIWQERWRPPVKTSTLAEMCTHTSAF